MIEHDVETTGLQYASGHRAFIHQFGDDEGNVVVLEAHQKQQIQAWLDRCEREGGYRAWNSKFDLHFADAAGLRLPDPACWHDGMLVAHVVDERRSVALQNVAESLFGEKVKSDQKAVHGWLKEERARRKKAATTAGEELIEPNFSDVPDDIMYPYAKEDVIQTRAVCNHYQPIVAQSDLQGVVDFERKVMAALFDVEKRGMPADEHGYRMLELELAANLETLEDRCVELAKAGSDFNPNSSQQLYEALEGLGADLSLVEAKSMDRENLSTVDHPLALAVLAFRGDYKALSTYTRPMISRHYEPRLRSWQEPLVTPEGRIHANYRQVGARTGRMSCSMPNMQNMPRDDLRLRYNIRAEEGHKLVTVDLSGVEMRLFAAFAGGGPILDALRKGEDPHVVTAERLGLRDKRRTEGVETARQRGKRFNFSQLYGGGLPTITKQLGCSRADARRYRDRYRDEFPEIVRLQQRIKWRLEDQGFIQSLWGRHYRVAPRDAFKAVNYLVQGTAADLLKESLLTVHRAGVPVVALVHDEIVAHVPEGDAEEAKEVIRRALVDHPAITEKVPLEAEGAIVDRWSDAKIPGYMPKWAKKEAEAKR